MTVDNSLREQLHHESERLPAPLLDLDEVVRGGKRRRLRARLLGGAGAVTVAVVFVAVAVFWQGREPETGPVATTLPPTTVVPDVSMAPPTTSSAPPATTSPTTATPEVTQDRRITAPASADFATAFLGPLIGGGEFDLTDYRHHSGLPGNGSFVVVLSWWPPPFCGPDCTEQLDVMQKLYEEYGQTDWFDITGGYTIEFVTVSEDTAAITSEALDQRSIDVPTVYCYPEPDPITHSQPFLCAPVPSETEGLEPWPTDGDGDPIGPLWGNPIQSITLVDVSGFIYEVYDGSASASYSDLEALLRFISGQSQGIP